MQCNTLHCKLAVLTVFSIAMGFIESAVVVYLREIYYPSGFNFPIAHMEGNIAITEVVREAATILMLLAAGILAGKNTRQGFALFIFCFAVWDIFYYVFLKMLIQWPESLLTWDILFLIPVIWTGPVIAPLAVSVTMILFAMVLLSSGAKTSRASGRWIHRSLIVTGIILVFISFIWDYTAYMLNHLPVAHIFQPDVVYLAMEQYIPEKFNWWPFVSGEMSILIAIYLIWSGSVKTTCK